MSFNTFVGCRPSVKLPAIRVYSPGEVRRQVIIETRPEEMSTETGHSAVAILESIFHYRNTLSLCPATLELKLIYLKQCRNSYKCSQSTSDVITTRGLQVNCFLLTTSTRLTQSINSAEGTFN